MKLQYLGTAAAEGWPALFCDCESCRKARTAGGRNIRTRSQAMLDDRLLIDLPPDTYHHLLTNNIDISFIENLIITHSHEDHWYPWEVMYRTTAFANYQHPENLKPLTVWGTSGIKADMEEKLAMHRLGELDRVRYREVQPFESYSIDGYTITPLPANHDPKSVPVIYQLSDGKRTMLYGNDTGIPSESVWGYWEKKPVHFDLVSLDCTGICQTGWRDGHMSLDTNAEVLDRLRALDCVDNNTIVVIHHFSHNGGPIYDELCEIVADKGWLVSFDGMVVEF